MTIDCRELYVDAGAPGPGTGSPQDPFVTVQQAVVTLQPGDLCLIRGGVYRETVRPARSGTRDAPVTFRAYPGEQVVISGCDPITGWHRDRDHVYVADVHLDLGHENQVFAGGQMLWEARWPSIEGAGPRHLLEFPTATMGEGTTPARIMDPSLPDRDWTGATVWVASHKRWYCWTGRVTGFGKGYLTLEDNTDAAGNHVCQPGGNYYVFGVDAALDAKNEWFYDAAARRLRLRMPADGVPAGIEIKRRREAFDLRGRSHISVEGLTITGATVATDERSQNIRLDGIRLLYPYHSSQAEAQYQSQRETGLVLRGAGHTVANCEIAYSSGDGVALAGHDCTVVNNHIHDCDYAGTYAAPVNFVDGAARNVVSHNTIERAGRSCIGTAGFHDSLLQYNDVGHAGYLTYDLGLTYGNGVEGGNSEVRYNWFHDNLSGHIAFGIYFDHGCTNLLIHHNAVWDVPDDGLHNNQYANYLLYYHNTVSGSRKAYRSTWAAAQKKDLYGCHLINSLGTAGIEVNGEGLIAGHNLWNCEALAKERYPRPGSAAIDAGLLVEGVNDDHQGAAPDCGAYELGGNRWRAGHDFDSPPAEIDVARTPAPHRNLLVNPAWHRGSLAGWEVAGDRVRVIFERHSQWVNDARVVMRGHSVALGAGHSAIRQTVRGLRPDTTYELMGMFRVDEGAEAWLAVIAGATEIRSAAVSGNAPHWTRSTLRFTTGPDQTSAVVFAAADVGEGCAAYVDDLGLQWVDEQAMCESGQD